MANVSLTRLQGGGSVTVDAATVSGIASLTAQQLREAGTSRGTRVTGGTAQPVDVQETVQQVDTIVKASNALQNLQGLILRDGMSAATQDFTAAAFADITGLSITIGAGQAGTYLFTIGGQAESSNAAASGGRVTVAKNGTPLGTILRWGVAQFIGNNIPAMGLGAQGPQLEDAAIVGDIYTVQAACVPGGGADIFRVRDVTLTALRRT